LGQLKSGVGVPPVSHAQDARATIKLHQRCVKAWLIFRAFTYIGK
jgi:hypothetical protein